jgi:hypothetical protein
MVAALAITLQVWIGEPHVQFWVQVLAGNWGVPPAGAVGSYELAISAIIGILLNNSLIFLAFGAFWGIILRDRRRFMKLSEALTFKDEAVKQALYAEIADDTETIKRIEKAFEKGNKDWRDYLIGVFSEAEASQLMEHIERTEIRS